MQVTDIELRTLLRDIENEAIDKTQWISKRDEVITSIRIDRGEINRHEGRYSVVDVPLPVDKLLSLKTIDRDQHFAAMDVISLRNVALSPMGHARLKFTASWLGRDPSTDECPLTIYSRIMRALLPWQSHMIDRLCFQDVRPNDWAWISKCNDSIVKSFEALKKSVDTQRDSSLESVTEEGISVSKF